VFERSRLASLSLALVPITPKASAARSRRELMRRSRLSSLSLALVLITPKAAAASSRREN